MSEYVYSLLPLWRNSNVDITKITFQMFESVKFCVPPPENRDLGNSRKNYFKNKYND
jgi:hypothetical protein